MYKYLKEIIHYKLVKDAISLYSAHVFNVVLGFVATIIIVRGLSPEVYGEFGLFYTSQLILSLIIELGIFTAIGRLIAISHSPAKQKEIMGGGLLLAIIAGFILSVINLIVSLFIDQIFMVKAAYLFKRWWWLTGFSIVQIYLWNIFEGSARIKKLSLFIILNKFTYFGILLLFFLKNNGLSPDIVIVAYFLPYAFWGIIFISGLKPGFKHIKQTLYVIFQHTREYGFDIFLSNALGFLSIKIDQYFVAFFFGAKEMGYYHLATNIAHPLTLFAKSASTSAYRKIANVKKLPRNMLPGLIGVSVLGAIGLIILVPFFLTPVFSQKFEPILAFFPIVVGHHLLYAVRIPFGIYFKAMAKGKLLFWASVFLIVTIVVFETLINTRLGIRGPALGMMLANSTILVVVFILYRRTRREAEKS
ncbi:MAG: hypothetical protein Kow00108_20780 [Calditrichia bacterium]